mgnify:CR=1 FL=1
MFLIESECIERGLMHCSECLGTLAIKLDFSQEFSEEREHPLVLSGKGESQISLFLQFSRYVEVFCAFF